MKIKLTNAPLRVNAFTLIEIITVIAVIAIIAALLMPAFNIVEQHSIIQHAQGERDQLETAIGRYYAKYGFYPPGNAAVTAQNLSPALTNQLYYELVGTTNINTPASPTFLTLDDRCTNTGTSAQQFFGVSGFMNCSRGNSEDAVPAQTFLPALKASQLAVVTAASGSIIVLSTSANGDQTYQPLPGVTTLAGYTANPWRYVYPGINNPKSYDLWLQIKVGGKTNLICNWMDQRSYNSSLP
jgi:prepilin-type N-terminal cleavage/methylation domain-containing protein